MAEQNAPDRDEMVRDFCDMCEASPEMATQYLAAHNWDYLAACNTFFTEDIDERLDEGPSQERPEEPYTGPRTVDGRPAPQAYRRSRNNEPAAKEEGVATLASLASASQQGGGNDDDDDADDDDLDGDTEDGRGNLFAGGEKSGLAVQDPKQEGGSRQIINDILAKARANSRPDAASEAGPSRSSLFRGTGMTLGGEGVQSRAVPDPLGPVRPANSQPLERVLHIWQDGFSIDDGELHRYDDPANRADLQMIRSGRAPLHLMNVQHDQLVDVKLHQHDTPYSPPPKQYKPFGGAGHRLGSPVPGGTSEAPATTAGGSTTTSTTTAATTSNPSEPAVDGSQPTVMIRIQLPDGTRLPARFNTTHTLGDVYGFIQGASPETRTRAWVLVTTFPNKEHKDKELVLGDIPEFKKGGTAVVKWT
ncbi:UBX domain-containing protein [Ophiocordyceps camponoti-floridani]|uniref:UBX domain-containing protein n=1 Tax=Ophiocordyceps camponoti-floridani TaxID=2030778 RepID=A0A8H4VDZ6_9HYPO|nr:UBX domain-containing protein [Ophiocordyceps camponoti-floridani]